MLVFKKEKSTGKEAWLHRHYMVRDTLQWRRNFWNGVPPGAGA